MEFSMEGYNYLVFIIPGFALVWTFRYFTRSEKKGDFELAGLSFLAGFITLGVMQFLLPHEKFIDVLKNPYSTAFAFSIFGVLIGFLVALLRKIFNLDIRKHFDWFVMKVRERFVSEKKESSL